MCAVHTYAHLKCFMFFMVKSIYIPLYHNYRVSGLHIIHIMRQEMKMRLGGVPFICSLRRKREKCLMDMSWQNEKRIIKNENLDISTNLAIVVTAVIKVIIGTGVTLTFVTCQMLKG